MVYHSSFNDTQCQQLCGMSLLPLKTKVKGPAPQGNPSNPDIIDEALDLFRANVLFRNFDIKGPADKLLIYITWYIRNCLAKIEKQNKGTAESTLYQMAIENFRVPGDKGFPLGGFVNNPKGRAEADKTRQYFMQLRQEIALRLVERVYVAGDQPSKWWTSFSKRKFLGL